MRKIFPSASDIAFAAKYHVPTHTVYTPYLVLNHPAGRTIANPTFSSGQYSAASRLNFEIRNATHIQDSNYRCQLAAITNGVEFWLQDVTTEGDGQLAPLHW